MKKKVQRRVEKFKECKSYPETLEQTEKKAKRCPGAKVLAGFWSTQLIWVFQVERAFPSPVKASEPKLRDQHSHISWEAKNRNLRDSGVLPYSATKRSTPSGSEKEPGTSRLGFQIVKSWHWIPPVQPPKVKGKPANHTKLNRMCLSKL